MKSLKLFLAIDLNEVEKQALHCISHDLRAQFKDGREHAEDRYHITLHFFAEVPEDRVADIKNAMRKAASAQKPFTVVTGRPGVFGSPESAIVFIGMQEGQAELAGLHDRLEKLLGKAGFLEENRLYQPHITLGREVDTRGFDPKLEEMLLPSMSLSAHALTLLEGTTQDGKPVYKPIASAEFKGK